MEEPVGEVADRADGVVAVGANQPVSIVAPRTSAVADQLEDLGGSFPGGSRSRSGRRGRGGPRRAAGSVRSTSPMPPSKSTSERVREAAGGGELVAVLPKLPARLTTRRPCSSSAARAIRTCSGVAQRQLRCAVQRSIASKPAAEIVASTREPLGERLERREGRVGRLVEGPPVVRGAVAELGGDVVRAHERERERGMAVSDVVILPHVATKWSSSIGRSGPSAASSDDAALVCAGAPLLQRCGTEVRSICVYGWRGSPKTFCGRAHLDDAAAAEDHRPVADVVAERRGRG